MKSLAFPLCLAATALTVVGARPVHATTVLSFNLDELSARAGRIFRGRVVDVRAGSVEAGGGTLPTTIYRVTVDEAFKGSYPRQGKGGPVVEIRMIGSVIPDLPRLRVGREYLLFTTVPSRIGLSAPVGLGQGCFEVHRPRGREPVAVNAVDNRDLFRRMQTSLPARGAAPYAELARAVRASLARQGRVR